MQALVLAGGSGTRFWPLSRGARPKQLLSLGGGPSLLQATVARLAPRIAAEAVWVCTTRELAAQVCEQLPEVPQSQVLAEPEGRDTAAAIGWSVGRIAEAAGDDIVVVLPADHHIGDAAAFRETLGRAAEAAAGGRVLTLGVAPRRPETGYGYLELGELLDEESGLQRVVRFTEKPDADHARAFVDSGNYLWNGGIFVFRGSVLLERLARHQPELAAGLEEIGRRPQAIDEVYPRLPRISIDHGVMEKLDDLATLPLDCGWSDLGSWAALAEVLPGDERGNRGRGDVVTVDSRDNLLYAEHGTVAVVGVEGLVVVRTGDAVLVLPAERSQEVRAVVAELEKRGRDDLL